MQEKRRQLVSRQHFVLRCVQGPEQKLQQLIPCLRRDGDGRRLAAAEHCMWAAWDRAGRSGGALCPIHFHPWLCKCTPECSNVAPRRCEPGSYETSHGYCFPFFCFPSQFNLACCGINLYSFLIFFSSLRLLALCTANSSAVTVVPGVKLAPSVLCGSVLLCTVVLCVGGLLDTLHICLALGDPAETQKRFLCRAVLPGAGGCATCQPGCQAAASHHPAALEQEPTGGSVHTPRHSMKSHYGPQT